jgi:hypothetical protein
MIQAQELPTITSVKTQSVSLFPLLDYHSWVIAQKASVLDAHDALSILFEEERFQSNYTQTYRRASFSARRVLFVLVLSEETPKQLL